MSTQQLIMILADFGFEFGIFGFQIVCRRIYRVLVRLFSVGNLSLWGLFVVGLGGVVLVRIKFLCDFYSCIKSI